MNTNRTARLQALGGVAVVWALAGCASAPVTSLTGTRHHDDDSILGSNSSSSTSTPCGGSGDITTKSDCDAPLASDPDADPAAAAPAAPAAPVAPAPGSPIKASLSVTRHPDTATFTNCLKIQVNDGPLVDLGCNHGPLVDNVQIDALAKPACNVVRLILFTNGTQNRTTQSSLDVALDFRIVSPAQNSFSIQCNDNGDNDFDDLNLDISSADATLSIENTGFTCQP